MANIYEIAKLTGFSPATVSKVINNYPDVSDKTRRLIEKVLAEQNFLPNSIAQSLTSKKTWTFGVVYQAGEQIGFNHPFFGNVLQAFKNKSEELGYSLLFACKNEQMKGSSVVEYLIQKRVDGILLLSTCEVNPEIKRLVDSSIPLVAIDFNNHEVARITSDNRQGVDLSVQYLCDLGHRKIGYISGGNVGENWISDLRREAFINKCKELNIWVDLNYIQQGTSFEVDGGIEAVKKILKMKVPPTAICCVSDLQAIGVIREFEKFGWGVPEDISIIGFDDLSFVEYCKPSLTTIRQDCHQLGSLCAEILKNQIISDKKSVSETIVPVQLIKRDTCRPIKE